ncbi:MAG: DUF1592 domain-containing protein [Rhodospirillaceae bacterium]|nr:DUF1592 domain-containing protein [Rhodospirillaceae bacterium]
MKLVFAKAGLFVAAAVALAACSPAGGGKENASASATTAMTASQAGGPAIMRRLTQEQYEQIIADVFGSTITLGGRFEPDVRENGLLAVGSGQVSVTAAGLEQYDVMARNVAAQVTDEKRRATLLPCAPKDAKAADDACARETLSKVGRLLYRRPLTQAEIDGRVAKAAEGAVKLKSYYAGLEASLAGMLVSPQFLFREELVEADPSRKGMTRLNGYTKAARLSFFLWNAGPDDELLRAAETGEIHTAKGLTKQVDRMLASPRLKEGTRAFFTDMLEFDRFGTLAKDAAIYPKFNFKAAQEAQEQTLRTIVDHTVTQNADYRDLFTTRKTYLTRLLGAIYRVPVDQPTGWVPYEFPENGGQAGILTQVSFVALHSHPGRTSPTLRGKALREVLLCQKVPDPPGNVDFKIVQETSNPSFKTVRQRLNAHATEAMCKGCHKITDPMGLALENFDTIGGYRTNENGAPIDTSGELDGIKFNDAAGLGKAVHDHPGTTSCLVNRVYSYAVGRVATPSEKDWVKTNLEKRFAEDGYKVPQLFRRIVTSDTFFRVIPPAEKPPAEKLAGKTAAAEKLIQTGELK